MIKKISVKAVNSRYVNLTEDYGNKIKIAKDYREKYLNELSY